MKTWSFRRTAWWLPVLLAVFAGLSVASLRQKSVTIDEYGYLPAAFHLISTGDLRYSQWHAPLVNLLLGVPLLGADVHPVELPAELQEGGQYWFWNNGDWFVDANRDRYHALLVRARMASVAFGIALGALVFVWAREIASPTRAAAAGLVACALTLFYPDVIAHSRFATLDIGLTFFFTLALFVFHRYVRGPTLRRAIAVGFALGLAQASKFTSLFLLPTIGVLMIAAIAVHPASRWFAHGVARRTLAFHLALIVAGSIFTLHACYFFQEPVVRVSEIETQSEIFANWQDTRLAQWPVPIPAQYLRAIDWQLHDQERGYQNYLDGTTTHGGRRDYFVRLLLAKSPVAGILLVMAAILVAVWKRFPRRLDSFIVLSPALLMIAVLSFSTKQLGLRMVLQAIPLVAVWVAAISPIWEIGRRWVAACVTLVGLFVLSCVLAHPHYLSYFNWASGGSAEGYRIGLGSNYDWGQDLPALKAWMDDRKLRKVDLIYYGRIDPSVYGIRYRVPRQLQRPKPRRLPLVVSASHYGLFYPAPNHDQRTSFDIVSKRDALFHSDRWVKERITPTLFVFERGPVSRSKQP